MKNKVTSMCIVISYYNHSLSRMVPLPSTTAGCRMASTLLVAQLLLAVGLAQLDKSSPQQQLPRLDTATEKGLSVCTRVLKGASIPDDQAWYTYFSCVEKELFKHKVVSELWLTINYNLIFYPNFPTV